MLASFLTIHFLPDIFDCLFKMHSVAMESRISQVSAKVERATSGVGDEAFDESKVQWKALRERNCAVLNEAQTIQTPH